MFTIRGVHEMNKPQRPKTSVGSPINLELRSLLFLSASRAGRSWKNDFDPTFHYSIIPKGW